MRLLILIFTISLLSHATRVEAQKALTTNDCEVTFKINNFGITINGFFSDVKMSLKMEGKDLESIQLNGALQTETVDTDNTMRNRHLKEDDYLDVENFPTITMVSKKIVSHGANKLKGTFLLTIKGVPKTIVMDIAYQWKTEDQLQLTGTFTLNRLDFGVGDDSWTMSDDVNVVVKGTFH